MAHSDSKGTMFVVTLPKQDISDVLSCWKFSKCVMLRILVLH